MYRFNIFNSCCGDEETIKLTVFSEDAVQSA